MPSSLCALKSIAAATSDIWPSIANTLMVPWKSPLSPKSTAGRAPATRNIKSSNSAATVNPTPPPAQRDATAAAVAKPELPEFLHDLSLKLSVGNALPNPSNAVRTDIVLDISNMSPRSLAMANPLFRRSYAALMARPLSTPFRSMSTYHPSRMQQYAWTTPRNTSLTTQQRNFGNGMVSRNILASREAAANRNPTSPTAQSAFYQLLLKANMPAIVVERYQSGRLFLMSLPFPMPEVQSF